jgi:pimeloyl-ACP methyl ester carboxylesterase
MLFLLIALLLTAPGPVRAAPFENSRFETLAGVQVHVRHWPADGAARGCPVLLLHGFGGSTYSFRELAPALAAAGHEVWAIDLPAYGYSARTPFPDTAGAALAPWLDANGRGWCLLGHSMGTRVVAELVAARPGEVASVVYLAGNPIPSAKELRSRDRFKSPRLRRWLAGLVESRYLSEEKIGELLAKAYGRPATGAEVEGYLTPLRPPGTALAIMNGYAAQWPVTPAGASLDSVPTLILWGEKDEWVKPEVADRLQAALPSARRVTVAGAGHCPMETHVAQTLDAVLAQFAPVSR